MSRPIEVTGATFEESVLASDRPVLVDFWAPWCAPCRTISPIVEGLGGQLEGRLTVAKLNIDDDPAVAARYEVFSLPTLVLFQGGQEVDRVVGFLNGEQLAARVAAHL